MARVENGSGAGIAPTSTVAIGVDADTEAVPPATAATEQAAAAGCTFNGCASPSVVTLSQVTTSFERSPPFAMSNAGPLNCLNLANGKSLTFSKSSVPDPPSISFAKDLHRLIRIWDDSAPEWTPSEALVHLEGEPIAVKYWRDLYRYGKPRQWMGTKKHWTNWRVSRTFCSVPPLPSATCLTHCRGCSGHRYELANAHGGRLLAQVQHEKGATVVHGDLSCVEGRAEGR